MTELGKITARHRERRAVVYVRQSTPGQVERNIESAARQYALAERAVDFGWPAASVIVVDEDTVSPRAGCTPASDFASSPRRSDSARSG